MPTNVFAKIRVRCRAISLRAAVGRAILPTALLLSACFVPRAAAAAAGRLQLELHDVHLERASGLRADAATLAVTAGGAAELSAVRFAATAQARPVTGTIDAASSDSRRTQWQFSGLTLYMPQGRVRMPDGVYTPKTHLVEAKDGVRLNSRKLEVTAKRARVDLSSQTVALDGNVRGTIKP